MQMAQGLQICPWMRGLMAWSDFARQLKTPMIYSNRNWFVQKLDMTRLGSYKLWLAHYANQPDFPYLYSGWQYTGEGTIAGIDQKLDLNVWMEGSVY